MDKYQEMIKQIPRIEKRIGFEFKDKKLLLSAFVHRSFLNESGDIEVQDNERLEFLGDAVLGLIVSEYLFCNFNLKEGDLSAFRSCSIDAASCAFYMRKLAFEDYIFLSKGEKQSKRGKERVLADAFEALLGAIFLEKGFVEARAFFLINFESDLKEKFKEPHLNYREKLQHYAQKNLGEQPEYKLLEESGPGHQKNFLVAVYLKGKFFGEGRGNSKKEAEYNAAKNACEKIGSL